MNKFEDYRLELEKYANNLNNKRQDYSHTINEDIIYDNYAIQLISNILMEENNVYDAMGDYDLKNYEKWLDDGF